MNKMKKSLLLLLLALFLLPAPGFAQKASELKWTDAQNLMLINQGYDNTELPYSRLPLDMKPATRKAVWDLGLNSAGLAIRFSTDSRTSTRFQRFPLFTWTTIVSARKAKAT